MHAGHIFTINRNNQQNGAHAYPISHFSPIVKCCPETSLWVNSVADHLPHCIRVAILNSSDMISHTHDEAYAPREIANRAHALRRVHFAASRFIFQNSLQSRHQVFSRVFLVLFFILHPQHTYCCGCYFFTFAFFQSLSFFCSVFLAEPSAIRRGSSRFRLFDFMLLFCFCF